MRELLKAFASLAGAVITIDAMHTQADTAQVILGQGAERTTVKANMPTLHRKLKKLPWAAVPAFSAVTTDHGRRVPHDQGDASADLDRVRRRRPGRAGAPHGHEERQEDRRGRLPHYQRPRRRSGHPGHLDRSHWEIENRLHWVRDVTYQEDKSLVRTGNAPRVMASLRSLAISILRLDGHSNIAAANRHHARDPQRTLQLLQTA